MNLQRICGTGTLETSARACALLPLRDAEEMWDLSMCLFHKMFGGACQPSDFEDIRPSSPGKTAQAEYNASELLGWQDDADAVVYQATVPKART